MMNSKLNTEMIIFCRPTDVMTVLKGKKYQLPAILNCTNFSPRVRTTMWKLQKKAKRLRWATRPHPTRPDRISINAGSNISHVSQCRLGYDHCKWRVISIWTILVNFTAATKYLSLPAKKKKSIDFCTKARYFFRILAEIALNSNIFQS